MLLIYNYYILINAGGVSLILGSSVEVCSLVWTQNRSGFISPDMKGQNPRMFMSDRINRINATIDNHIHVWSSIASFAPLAEILQNDREILVEKLLTLTARGVPKGQDGRDAVRLFLLGYALERITGRITSEHFTIFRDAETVQVILEDSFGVICQADWDEVLIPHQNEALKIIIQCLFRRVKPADRKGRLMFSPPFLR